MPRTNNLKLGDWNALCQRCGLKFKASALKKTWDNLHVCKGCWEPRHDMDFYRGKSDDPSVPWVSPDDTVAGGVDINGNTVPPTFVDIGESVPTGTFTSNNNDLDRTDE